MKSKRADIRGDLFGTKWKTRIGFWNVRTLPEYSKLKQGGKEMTSYKLDIMGLSETRWENDEIKIQNEKFLIFSGVGEDIEHRSGEGILMNKAARRSVMEWSPISEILARFKTKIRNLTIIQCYAPTETTNKDMKEKFHQQLHETITAVQKKDVIIVMGDMNAKIGSNNEGLEHVMGRHVIGNMNENGELFSDLCASCDLIIGGTVFPDKTCHKLSWVSPNNITENQIDHIAISKRLRSIRYEKQKGS